MSTETKAEAMTWEQWFCHVDIPKWVSSRESLTRVGWLARDPEIAQINQRVKELGEENKDLRGKANVIKFMSQDPTPDELKYWWDKCNALEAECAAVREALKICRDKPIAILQGLGLYVEAGMLIAVIEGGLSGTAGEALLAQVEQAKDDYVRACRTVALMHEAAMGKVCGPEKGVVQDVAALRERMEKLMKALQTAQHAVRWYSWHDHILVADRDSMEAKCSDAIDMALSGSALPELLGGTAQKGKADVSSAGENHSS